MSEKAPLYQHYRPTDRLVVQASTFAGAIVYYLPSQEPEIAECPEGEWKRKKT